MSASASTTTIKVVTVNSERKFLVIDNEDNVEYIIKTMTDKKGQEVYELYYSNADCWLSHVSGTLRLKMTNVGDGMKFKLEGNKKMTTLDYAELEVLRILINFERDSTQETEHQIIEVKLD